MFKLVLLLKIFVINKALELNREQILNHIN